METTDEPASQAPDQGKRQYPQRDSNPCCRLERDARPYFGGQRRTTVGTGLARPTGVAVDAAGDVFIADSGNNQVVEVPAGGGAQTTVRSGLNSPFGVAVDVPSTASTFGAPVSLTATVESSPAGGAPTGTVTFTDGTTTLGTANLSGTFPDTATLTTSALPAGTDHITATYNGDTNNTASPASAPITVNVAKAAQAINFNFTSTPPSPATVGGRYTPAATGGASGNPVVFTIDPAFTIAGACSINASGVVTFTSAGTCVIDANQAGNTNFNAAAQAHQSVAVGKAAQAITFTSTPPANATVGGHYTPTATGGGSGNPVVFTIDAASTAGACSISATGMVSFTGAGTCVIDANQAGNTNFSPAAQVQQS
ncbi:MAG: Ig-like domain repeat protein, partial [Actinomycetota bacterium]|nr:Ig-like domain repeat protein [Actinomycetota bacterium]